MSYKHTEEDLQRYLKEGDYATLFENIKPIVWGMALRKKFQTISYEDAVQDAYLKLWKVLPQYDPSRGPVRPFIIVCVSQALWTHNYYQARQIPFETSQLDLSEYDHQDKPTDESLWELCQTLRSDLVQSKLTPLMAQHIRMIADAYEEHGALTKKELQDLLGLHHSTIDRTFKLVRSILVYSNHNHRTNK